MSTVMFGSQEYDVLTESFGEAVKRFNKSHDFRKGDRVIVLNMGFWGGAAEGVVVRAKANKLSGPCLRVSAGGVGVNIYKPHEELVKSDPISRALYL